MNNNAIIIKNKLTIRHNKKTIQEDKNNLILIQELKIKNIAHVILCNFCMSFNC